MIDEGSVKEIYRIDSYLQTQLLKCVARRLQTGVPGAGCRVPQPDQRLYSC